MVALALAPGCAVTSRAYYSPAELHQRLIQLDPTLRPEEVVVPFELPPEALAEARRAVVGATSEADRVQRLVKAMFDPKGFDLHYGEMSTTTGAETLRLRRGNCVGLASVFVGLARSVGLDARYVDDSIRIHEVRYGRDGTAVYVGHVTAMVMAGNERLGLDFTRAGTFRYSQPIDDLEALAHFYNNVGYEQVDAARQRGDPPDWAGAARQFERAVTVRPTFARAWNNLGLAQAHLGHLDQATSHFRRAIALDPDMSAPRANLGALLLQSGQVPAALESLEAAADLEPAGARLHYNLAVARLRAGDRDGAIRALRRALALRAGDPGSRALLEQLAPGSAGDG
jgi:tetratricopeptide (TPR) repeat protein